MEQFYKICFMGINYNNCYFNFNGNIFIIGFYYYYENSLEECINKGQQVTRNYVKRQHTWWKSSKLEIFQKFDKFPSEIDINSIKIN